MSRQELRAAAGQLANTAIARGARSYAAPDLARDGFVVRPQFITDAEAAAMRADLEPFTDRARAAAGVDGVIVRDRAKRQTRDLHVRQLTSAGKLSPAVAELSESGRVEQTFSHLVGRPLHVGGVTAQIDWPDTETKRGLHVDSHWPPTYKAFVYLTPVAGTSNGPFCVVPGSHRHRMRKLRAIARDYRHRRDHTDLDDEYAISEARPLLGGPGTAIFADQRLAHAGHPDHTEGIRIMLVVYLYEPHVPPPAFLGGR